MVNRIYANARAAALSKNLLGRDRLGRMLDATNVDEAIRVLAEVNFGDGAKIESALDFEKLLEIEEGKFLNFLKEQGLDKDVASFFVIKNDYHNAEAFVKCKYLKKDYEDMSVHSGNIDKAVLKELIYTDDYASLPKSMQKALITCDEDFASNKATGVSVNSAFTKAYFEHLYSLTKKDKLLKKIYAFKVDGINIGTALRSRKYSVAKDWFLKNGTLGEKPLKALCEEPLENLKQQFVFTDYKQAVSLAVDAKLASQPLSSFEKLIDELALNFINTKKYSIEGNVPLIKYCLQKQAEISAVRQILVGLLNKIEKNDIKNTLRAIYEG